MLHRVLRFLIFSAPRAMKVQADAMAQTLLSNSMRAYFRGGRRVLTNKSGRWAGQRFMCRGRISRCSVCDRHWEGYSTGSVPSATEIPVADVTCSPAYMAFRSVLINFRSVLIKKNRSAPVRWLTVFGVSFCSRNR
jgi:hypothetical protein